MTGRELIIFILSNGLEDEPVFKNGKFVGFITAVEAAEKIDVGTATIKALLKEKRIEGITIGTTVYIPINFKLKGDANDRQ